MRQALASELGETVEVEVPEREVVAEVDIRSEDVTFYESESGRFFISSPEIEPYIEMMATAAGADVRTTRDVPDDLQEVDRVEREQSQSADYPTVEMTD